MSAKNYNLMNSGDVCDMLKISETHLQKLRKKGLPFIQVSIGTVRYDPDDVRVWLDERTAKILSDEEKDEP